MKQVFTLFSAVLITISAFAQSTEKKADEIIKFKETAHDFGKIKQGVPVTYDFNFSNVGDAPLIIETANASCGCTTPTWPKQPILKGKSDKLTAGFNAAAVGPFHKSIYVKLAGVTTPVEIKISGEVVAEAKQ
jgi:hypothetical protein